MSDVIKTPFPTHAQLWEHVQPGDFIDGYAVKSDLTPQQATQVGFTMPGWANWLLALRNKLVKPLGLKTSDSAQPNKDGALFPVTYSTDIEHIIGIDDSHLNFRVSVMRHQGQIHMATWVHRNNQLGRLYLSVVMPFHILLVRNSMKRIARTDASSIASRTIAH